MMGLCYTVYIVDRDLFLGEMPMQVMRRYYVSVRNHRDHETPLVVFETDDKNEAEKVYHTLEKPWFDRSHEDDEYSPDGSLYAQWWDDAPRLIERTGESDCPTVLLNCAYCDMCL